jgi:hypothetical protein
MNIFHRAGTPLAAKLLKRTRRRRRKRRRRRRRRKREEKSKGLLLSKRGWMGNGAKDSGRVTKC